MNRRTLLGRTAAFALLAAARAGFAEESFEYTLTEEEWRAKLTETQYAVLREEDTERAGSSPLDKVYDAGTYHCAGCDLPVYSSEAKYDSGTGWPSFFRPLPGAIGTTTDYKIGYPRTEVHCRRCGGHLGHVFDDGPRPTGKRYCMNGAAMVFIPA